MESIKKHTVKHTSAGIILGIFLSIFVVAGACLFSPVASPFALQASNVFEMDQMDMENSHQDYILLHPGGGFFAIDTVTTNIWISILAILGGVFFLFQRKDAFFSQKDWQRLAHWAELHNPHSSYLSLFQDGIIHPKAF